MPRWILNSRDFSFLTSTRFLMTLGTQVQAVAVGWLVYQIKRDPLYLGLIGLTEALPALGLALLSGWIVDRGRPLQIYQRAICCSAASAFILCTLSYDTFSIEAPVRLMGVFFAAFLTGVARSFLSPSEFTILPLTVERRTLSQASAWNTSFTQIARLSGPALGGIIYGLTGERTTFLLILTLILGAFFTSQFITVGRQMIQKSQIKNAIAENFFSGFRFVFQNQIILAAISLDMFAILFGGANSLFPIFASDIFFTGPFGLGILRAAMPVGSFLMGWFLIRVPIARFSGQIMILAFMGFGLCMIGFGLTTSFPLAVFLLIITGMCDSVSMVTRQTILQLSTPPTMRGRVASVNAIFIGSSNEIGAFESGLAAKLLGTQVSVVFGGCMTLMVVAFTWLFAPRLKEVKLAEL